MGFSHNPNDSLGNHPIPILNSNALNEEGLWEYKKGWMWRLSKFKSAAKWAYMAQNRALWRLER